MIQYVQNEYVSEVMVLDLTTATFNDLQDSHLWDWVTNHLKILAKRMLCGTKASDTLDLFLDSSGLVGKYDEWSVQPGSAEELVTWILDMEEVF